MKRNIIRYAALMLAGALLFGGCREDHFLEGGEYIPALNSATLAPETNASGTKQAYIGTEVSVQGFNLDRLSAVTVADVPAEITAQSIKELKFRIPALELAQSDLPHEVEIKAFDARQELFFTYAYYVTVPVVDASVSGYAPVEGTVGTEITLSGRNLAQITRVHFGAATVEAADFTEVDEAGGFVKFLVPAGDYGAPDSEVAIAAEWGTETLDVTGEALFWVHVPVFTEPEQAEGAASAIGDELELAGRNLDLVKAVKWGETALVIAEQSSEALKVRFPSSIVQADPAVQAKALVAEWGLSEPAQTLTLAEAWRVDTTPSSAVIAPEFGTMTVEDGKFYLGKTVTVAGANLSTVEGIELQYGSERVAAEVLAGATDSELKFSVPDGVTFDTATEVSVVALYNGGEQTEVGKATVYPFYCYKDVTIGARDKTNRSIAFFLPDLGRAISTDEWRENDKYASATVLSAKNVLDKTVVTKEQYYEVLPYFFCVSGSSTFTVQGPTNTNTALKNFQTSANASITGGESWYGTPLVGFRNLFASGTEAEAAAAVRDGSIETMVFSASTASTATPAYDFTNGADDASKFKVGSVLLVQYSTYEWGQIKAKKEAICRTGFIHIKGVTASASNDNTGKVTFDMYWSKTLNE